MPDILNNKNLVESTQEEEKVIPPIEVKIDITPDKMIAYLKVNIFDESQTVTKEEVLEKLKEANVIAGINEEALNDYCKHKQFYKEIKIAKGVRAVNGVDGTINFYFQKEMSMMPITRTDGTLDFKNLDIIQNVEKDELLCELIPATEGTNGNDVFGNTILPKPGKNPQLPAGKNTYISESKTQLFAKVDGSIQYINGKSNIEENYVITTNVGPETGNINVKGNVIIHGNVLEGFNVTAQKNITVKGLVEGATLNAGENILIASGFNGMGKGKLKAVGNVTVKFIENGEVYCGGSVRTEVALISRIKAGKDIIIKGSKASLVAGIYQAGNIIAAKNIGSSNNNNIELILKSNWYEDENAPEELKKDKNEKLPNKKELIAENEQFEQLLDIITNQINEMNKFDNVAETVAQKKINVRQLIMKKSEINGKLVKNNEKLKMINDVEATTDVKIICNGIMHSGTKITMNYQTIKITQDIQNQKLSLNNGEIEITQILPHEKDIK